MDETDHWRNMASAPRDGSRILVTVRSSEQGPAEVDMAYWSRAERCEFVAVVFVREAVFEAVGAIAFLAVYACY